MDDTWVRAQAVLTDLAGPLDFLARWEYANSRKQAAWPIQRMVHDTEWHVLLVEQEAGYEAVKRALANDLDAQWACEPPLGHGDLINVRDVQWDDHTQSLTVWGDDEALEAVQRGWNLIKVPLVFTRALQHRLIESRDQQTGNARLLLQTLGRAPLPAVVTPDGSEGPNEVLNADQHRAVDQALNNPVTLIWGPPGTGKTSVITAFLEACWHRGDAVLLVSHTHQAVDEPLIRLVRTMESSATGWHALAAGLVQRWGGRTSPALRQQRSRGIPLTDILVPDDRAERVARRQRWHRVAQAISQIQEAPDRDELWVQARQQWAIHHLLTPSGDRLDIGEDLTEDLAGAIQQGEAAWQADASQDFAERGWPQIVGATVTHAFLSILDWTPDVVIVDEATMSIAPALAMLALMAGSRIVLAGDFWQLPAIRPALTQWPPDQQEAARRWIHRDIFAVHGIVPQGLPRHPGLVALSEQHRMHETICQLVNGMVYAPALHLTTHCDPPPPVWPEPSARLVLIDTAPLRATAQADHGSWMNVAHQQVIMALMARLANDDPQASIGVVTPFRPQARQLSRQLAVFPQVVAATAHRFQGSERAIMILDPVKQGGQNHPFLGNTISARQLWNVAVSRAQRQVIIIAPSTWAGPSTIPARLIRYVQHYGVVVDARTLLMPTGVASEMVPVGWG